LFLDSWLVGHNCVGDRTPSSRACNRTREKGSARRERTGLRTHDLHRYAHRAAYDRPTIDAILDEGIVCHVGLQTDKGFPVVIPLAYGRVGDVVYLHGSAASRLFRGARAPSVEICMTVTFVDGLVVARSTYNTDINYRSVVIIGEASEVKDLEEKRIGLEASSSTSFPGAPPTPARRPRRSFAAPCCSSSRSPSPRQRSAPGGRPTRRRTTTCPYGPGSSPSPPD
jgi:nitroimidazol reductase NimA-like FMN-containing flavoprotein (pyridoxamine 5'-phosphate oxidase superfamily)